MNTTIQPSKLQRFLIEQSTAKKLSKEETRNISGAGSSIFAVAPCDPSCVYAIF